ncbi:MAG: ABC transporter transmembrane domain-containing protein, partial [Chloroflexota bacterium]
MKALFFVFAYAKHYVKQLVVAIVSMLGLVGVQLYGPQVIRRLVAMVTERTWDASAQAEVTRLALFILALYLVRFVLRFFSNYMSHVAGWHVVADVRRRVYEHLQHLSLRFYENKQVGELMSRMVNDSDQFERLIAHTIPDSFVNVLMLLGIVAVLISMSWQLMALTVVPIPLIVLAAKGFGKYVRPAFRERQKDLAELNASLN